MNLRLIKGTVLGLLACSLLLPSSATAEQSVSVDDVKLALVYKIARFVTWPEETSDPFLLCVTGGSAYEAARAKLAGRNIREREVRVEEADMDESSPQRCDALYLASGTMQQADQLLARYANEPVLTLSDSNDFVMNGGMVGLTIRNKRVNIQINVANYERVGLSVNSQLLQLAELVGEQKAQR